MKREKREAVGKETVAWPERKETGLSPSVTTGMYDGSGELLRELDVLQLEKDGENPRQSSVWWNQERGRFWTDWGALRGVLARVEDREDLHARKVASSGDAPPRDASREGGAKGKSRQDEASA